MLCRFDQTFKPFFLVKHTKVLLYCHQITHFSIKQRYYDASEKMRIDCRLCSAANARPAALACALFSHCARAPHQYSASIKPTFKIGKALINTSICAPPKIAFSNINDVTQSDYKENLSQQWGAKDESSSLWIYGSLFHVNIFSMILVKCDNLKYETGRRIKGPLEQEA